MPDEPTHSRKRITTLITAYDPNEDYTQPTLDFNAVTNYLRSHDLFEEWLNNHPEAA